MLVSWIAAVWLLVEPGSRSSPLEDPPAPPEGAPSSRGPETKNVESGRVRDFREVYAATAVTRAVDRGVAFLQRTQLPDGSWLAPMGKNTGVISLACLALLAAGNEPGRGGLGEVLDRAVSFVASHKKDGLITTSDTSHGPLYEHGIATLLLGEILGMIKDDHPDHERLWRLHQDGVQTILRAQQVPKDQVSFGGWRYNPTSTDSDISVTGWQLLALRAAQDAGVSIPERSIAQALGFVKRCMHPSGGFAYSPQGGSFEPNPARSGTGILCLEICGQFGSPEARNAGDWLLKNPIEWKGPFFYYSVYYTTQAMYQLGGGYWEDWRPLSEGLLLEHQGEDGSWPAPPHETHERQAGPAYTTALALLSLTVEYRYLPIYQR